MTAQHLPPLPSRCLRMKSRFFVLPALLVLAACSSSAGRFALEAPRASAQTARPAADSVRSAGPLQLAAIGSYMDAQESDLRNRLRGTGAVVTRPGDDLVIVLGND